MEMGKTPSMLDLFEFDDGITPTREVMDYQWRSDDSDGEEEIDVAETRAFWASQHQLLQEALSRRSPTEVRVQRGTEDAIRKMESDAVNSSICTCSKECRRNCVLRDIADRLRGAGYGSAALCKSKWRRSPDIPAGEHNYIDAIVEPKNSKKGTMRIVIEPNFRAEFEMARANSEYNRLVGELPEIFVGKSERLRNVIRIMCGAAKRCMKDNKMHMAPWRKYKYMQAKWLGTCERVVPSFSLAAAVVPERPARLRASMLTFDLHCGGPAVEVL